MSVALIRPNPPKLSEARDKLRAIEDRQMFSNFGPVNTSFEKDVVSQMFGGSGYCLTTCNATIGLMLAIQQALGCRPKGTRYALMPSFTFAAAAQAAMWCGLTPLLCDIDPETWASCPRDEERLLAQYGDAIAIIVPYATFGYDIDLSRYETISARYGVPVVVDAAASLGTTSAGGQGFGTGFSGAVVFSMHATKAFSTGEAGLIYSGSEERIQELRQMCNFGFGQTRSATRPGLNGKLSEIGALLCQERLDTFSNIMECRAAIMMRYRHALPKLTFQPSQAGHQAHQFGVGLLPKGCGRNRRSFLSAMTDAGIGNTTYFSPHLAQQSYFAKHALFGDLPVTDDVAGRVICLPMFDTMTEGEVDEVVAVVRREMSALAGRRSTVWHSSWAAIAAK
jgi:dTDP-4-amino-4,6-dideoxygalactose transaminase